MKRTFLYSFILLLVFIYLKTNAQIKTIANGRQPQISIDTKGIIRVAYGLDNKIYFATSTNKGLTFSNPTLVATLPKMQLGMGRGPQIASSKTLTVITAMDESGKIYSYKLIHSTNKWQKIGIINDANNSAPEGLMSIAADTEDHFYAVWLDTRLGGNNNIYFSSLSGNETKWNKNLLAYQSPDEHVCECCKPSIAVKDSKVVLMFRNWLNGSRDLYTMQSINRGKTFEKAQKAGEGTWKLDGCPMDGGGVSIDNAGIIHSAWRREGSLYYSKPEQKETMVATGKGVSISSTNSKPIISFQDAEGVSILSLKDNKKVFLGTGNSLKTLVLPDQKIACVWEQDQKIRFKII